MLITFILSLLTAAISNVNEPDLYTLFPLDPLGDVLNVTQCYCQSPDPLSPDATFGYYRRYDYWNFHLSRSYSISLNCTSSALRNSNGTKPAKCIDHIRKHKSCQDFPDGNKFCYKFKEDLDNPHHDKKSSSKYGFNNQHRRVPRQPSDFLPLENATQNCDFYCNEELGGLQTFPTLESSMPEIGRVANSVVSYTDLDDMCYNCA